MPCPAASQHYMLAACLPDGVLQLRLKDMPILSSELRLTSQAQSIETEAERAQR